MPHRLYTAVVARAKHYCEYCIAPEHVFNLEFEVDHIVPTALGGLDTLENLALACRSCNVRKGAAQRALDRDTGQIVALFNPRVDLWDNHFRLDVQTFKIDGVTPEGRATAQRLGMNRKKAVDARSVWLSYSLPRAH